MDETTKPKSLIARPRVKRFVLDVAAKRRNGRFTRVSAAFLDQAEAALKNWCVDQVMRQGGGKTL